MALSSRALGGREGVTHGTADRGSGRARVTAGAGCSEWGTAVRVRSKWPLTQTRSCAAAACIGRPDGGGGAAATARAQVCTSATERPTDDPLTAN